MILTNFPELKINKEFQLMESEKAPEKKFN